VVENEEVCRLLRLTPAGVIRRTGIRTRRWVSEGQTTATLAVRAGRLALENCACSPDSIEAVLLSTTSPDMAFPSTACLAAAELGIPRAAAFDVAGSCSGFLYGLSMADAFIRSGHYRRCLVVAAEVKSRFLNPADEATAILFGDGAGAVVIGVEDQEGPDRPGMLGIRLYADGSRHDLIRMPAGGSRRPQSRETVEAGLHAIQIRGGPLFRAAVKRLALAVTDLMKEFGVEIDDVRHAVFHQANGRLLAALADRLGLGPEAVTSVLDRYGNASSASLPLALDEAARAGKMAPGDLVLLGAFGGGLTWGAALLRW
jgi:3-oxoacyl-[acyl-carrier-protein] synthase-3